MISIKTEGIFLTAPFLVSGCILLLIILCCAFAPILAPYGESEQDLSASLAPPSPEHLLGADKMGRDLFSRLLYGGRVTLLSALGVVFLSVIIGAPLGLFAGFYGGKFDSIVGRVCDVLLSFPSLLLAFLFVAALGRGIINAVTALGIVYVPMLTRLVRSLTLVEKNKTYVEAAESTGFSRPYILFRHIFPNCVDTMLVQLTLDLAYAILDLAALSFIGLGVSPPTADWGAMLQEGRNFLLMSPLLALAPGAAIVVTVISLNMFSDCITQYLDPQGRILPSFDKMERRRDRGSENGDRGSHFEILSKQQSLTPGPQTPGTSPGCLSVENLSCDFLTVEGIVYALNGVNLQLRRGEIHGLVGESGCGKSVTSRAILGLVDKKHTRLNGQIMFDGRNLLALPEKEMRSIRGKRISMIFQDPLNSLSPLMTVGSQIEEAMANHLDLPGQELRRLAASLLEKVGLHPDTAKQYPFELSGGMQQRVMIAQAVSCNPELLIADEPTTALDLTIQAQVLSLLRDLQKELSLTVLLITHNFALVTENCDRASVMYSGRVVETAPAYALIRSAAHPYTRALINCIPRPNSDGPDSGESRRAKLPVIPGSPPRLYAPQEGCAFAPRCPKAGEACAQTPEVSNCGEDRSVSCHHPFLGDAGC